jgi:hypothetical protein
MLFRTYLKRLRQYLSGGRRVRRPKKARRRLELEGLEDRALMSIFTTGVPDWVEQGPNRIVAGGSVEFPTFVQAGAIDGVAVHPTDPNTLYVSTVNGGIWRTNNATAANPNWVPLTDQFRSLSMSNIAFSPLDATNRTLFAGVARFSSGGNDGSPLGGVFRTTDGGNTWSVLGQSVFGSRNVQKVVPTWIVDSGTGPGAGGQVVLAATDKNLFRSTDGGQTWTDQIGFDRFATKLLSGVINTVVADPANASRFYAGVKGRGIFRSDDAGLHWAAVNNNITTLDPSAIPNADFIELAVHSSGSGNVVYAGVYSDSNPVGSVYRSADQGTTWTRMQAPPTKGQLLADRTSPFIVYIAGGPAGVFRGNAAQSDLQWSPLTGAAANNTGPHVDSRDLDFALNGDLLDTNDSHRLRRYPG